MPSFSICPECKERLDQDARRCACGWKKDKGPALDPFRDKCSWVDGTDRCRWPGSLSHETRGATRWLCAFHFFNGDPAHAARITEQSFEWDGKPESYVALRKTFEARARLDAHTGSQRVSGVPQQIRQLVQNFRVPGDKAA